VIHVASHAINVGDGALNSVIQQRLASLTDAPIDFELIDVAVERRELRAQDVEGADLVVVGGGGAISIASWNSLSGTALPMRISEIERSRTPFAVVAIGHNLFAGEQLVHREQLLELLELCEARSFPFSVRNDGSLDRLRKVLGPERCQHIIEVPDPGFFVDAPPRIPPEAGRDRYALIQVAGDNAAGRFSAGSYRPANVDRALRLIGRSSVDRMLDGIADLARHLVDAHDLDVVFAPHVPADVPLIGDLFRRLPSGLRTRYARRPFRILGLPNPRGASAFFGAYSAAQLVVGMRGHAVICGVGVGIPTVAIDTHPKIAGFMRSCDLDDHVVTLSSHLGGDLVAAADDLLGAGRAAHLARRAAATGGFADRLDALLRAAVAQTAFAR
jgi:polysaccharide pyruvyl transferase WcaK-like protein